jgi:MraZ protein
MGRAFQARHNNQAQETPHMALFLSTYVNKIDKKGRVSVPALFRSALAAQSFQGVVLFRSMRFAAVEGCGMDRMEQLSQGLDNFDQFSEPQADLAASIFADAQPLPFDSEGRILLPDAILKHAKLSDQAAFVGCGATFQLWAPQLFASHQTEARQRAAKSGTGISLVRKQEK